MKIMLTGAALVLSGAAFAEIPGEYSPTVVEAPFSISERVFDLTPAIARARKLDRPLFVYVGAADCGPCREYKSFLRKSRSQLENAFDKVVVVDVRTWLKGPPIAFKIGENRYSFAEFKQLVGDANSPLVYPYHWFITSDLKQIRQLPLGNSAYMTTENHIALLQWP